MFFEATVNFITKQKLSFSVQRFRRVDKKLFTTAYNFLCSVKT